MRLAGPLLAFAALVALPACDDDPKSVPSSKAGPSASSAPSAAPSATATVAAPPSAVAPSAVPSAAPSAIPETDPAMPPRPFPVGSSGPVQPSAPPEQQRMAITYTLAMVAPQPSDPLVDKAYVEEMVKKLGAAARSADKGKTPANPVTSTKGGRKLEVEMGKGCTDRIPRNLLQQRAGSSLKAAFDAGVLVISCHDDKWACHQSTRNPADVLCHAAPRR